MSDKKTLVLSVFFVFHVAVCWATDPGLNEPRPEVGKPCPDFMLRNVTHYNKRAISLSDFKGSWLFLEFWFSGCSTCIKSFKKMDELKREFANDNVRFMLVGCNNKRNSNAPIVFERMTQKQGLDIPTAYDSVLVRRWGITTMPHIIVVDPQGIVRYITDGRDMSKEKVRSMIGGSNVSFFDKDLQRKPFSAISYSEVPLVSSLFTNWRGEAFNVGCTVDEYVMANRSDKSEFRFAGVGLSRLYNTAYFGQSSFTYVLDPLYAQIYPAPVLQIKDTSHFNSRSVETYGTGLYNYSLRMEASKISKERIMECMQQDLHQVFGYTASVEQRKMPIWVLTALVADAKLKTKGGPSVNSALKGNAFAGFEMKNVKFKEFTRFLFSYLSVGEKNVFVDSTGIVSNIDITLEADMLNITDVKKELNKYGLDLKRSYKLMKVLIIKD